LPRQRERLGALARTLHAVSPLPTLERGYSVTLDPASGATVRSLAQLQPGQTVRTRLLDGHFTAQVERLEPMAGDSATKSEDT
jgi:exodeoxyribonuclease VII large subunit